MKQKRTVLFLPFLQISSGHHQAATAIIDSLKSSLPHLDCKKIDILSYSYGRIESLVSSIYLKWIHVFPNVYHFIYQLSVYRNVRENKRYRLYELLFIPFMKKLISESKPDFIICTHALPSYMLNVLKERGMLSTTVINIYTDYFIHRFWGMNHIDYHFVPTFNAAQLLVDRGVSQDRIFQTGIPVHSKIVKQTNTADRKKDSFSILVSGGNLGVGAIESILEKTSQESSFTYYVLCGKNKKLFDKLTHLERSNIIPLSYISCREKMNELYDKIDAIITKPGGVTVSEALLKKKPIFSYHALPGQERINLKQLDELGVIIPLKMDAIEEQLTDFFNNQDLIQTYVEKVDLYHQYFYQKEPSKIIEELINKSFNSSG
ncbi:UDP-glucuronosyltransferase [Bacillus sp. 31A1R]|uniref:UDP-glucuronosyltransferase n=1 Tax=Robertmurraya mangrovi TaxID=3098077 RepID=A0ABU5J357_9BACI|nr:UDP-glucuronosyltransferase [Bacillus sp. 31A1R]MDZ5473776.1 UDP-glucuronosyltransferase [Bacillus sp. 31A1R]